MDKSVHRQLPADTAGLKSGAAVTKAASSVCPLVFGGKFHPTHAVSIGLARKGCGDAGAPLAMCRGCGCYSSHATGGLARPCDLNRSNRRSKLRRFMRGLHPEPKPGVVVECVRHYRRGHFEAGRAGSVAAVLEPAAAALAPTPAPVQRPCLSRPAPPAGERSAAAAALRTTLDLGDDWHDHELDQDLQDPALASWPNPEAEDEDIFGFGGDLGESAYVQDPQPPSARGPPETSGSEDLEETAPLGNVQPTMLETIESRLSNAGEEPRFRACGPGQLLHECRLVQASISFWPGSLMWSASGPQQQWVEDLLLTEPVASNCGTKSLGDDLPQPAPRGDLVGSRPAQPCDDSAAEQPRPQKSARRPSGGCGVFSCECRPCEAG